MFWYAPSTGRYYVKLPRKEREGSVFLWGGGGGIEHPSLVGSPRTQHSQICRAYIHLILTLPFSNATSNRASTLHLDAGLGWYIPTTKPTCQNYTVMH